MTDREIGLEDRQFQNELEAFRTLTERMTAGQEGGFVTFDFVNTKSMLVGIDTSDSSLSSRLKDALGNLPSMVDVRVSSGYGLCGIDILGRRYKGQVGTGILFRDLPGESQPDSIFHNLATFDDARVANRILENLSGRQASDVVS